MAISNADTQPNGGMATAKHNHVTIIARITSPAPPIREPAQYEANVHSVDPAPNPLFF
jgi:hypothetical protein